MHAAAKLPTLLSDFVAQEGHESDGNEPLVSPGRTFSPISAGKRLLKPTPRKLPRKVEKDVRDKNCLKYPFGVALEMAIAEGAVAFMLGREREAEPLDTNMLGWDTSSRLGIENKANRWGHDYAFFCM